MCHDPRSYGDLREYTDISWHVRPVGVEKVEEKEENFRFSSIVGYWV